MGNYNIHKNLTISEALKLVPDGYSDKLIIRDLGSSDITITDNTITVTLSKTKLYSAIVDEIAGFILIEGENINATLTITNSKELIIAFR